MTKAQLAERDAARAKLREWIKPGSTVYTILRHVSRSGMSRDVGIVVFLGDKPLFPNYLVALAIGARVNKAGDGVVMGGAGMDMGFALVYNLASALWPDGHACTGDNCPSNDHTNLKLGELHRDGGYALRQEWL